MPISKVTTSIRSFDSRNDFPSVGSPNDLYTINGTSDLFKWDNSINDYVEVSGAAESYLGAWDASTNTPMLADGTGNNGDFYLVSVAGTRDLGSGPITFTIGDQVIYNGAVWQDIQGGVNYIPEDVANKATDFSTVNNTLYPSVQAVNNELNNINNNSVSTSTLEIRNPNDLGSDYDFTVNSSGELLIGDDLSDFGRIRIQANGNVVMSNNVSAANLSGTNTGDQDLTGLVPYTGATENVDLGTNQITASTLNVGTDTIINDDINGVRNISGSGILIMQTGISSGGNIASLGNITATGSITAQGTVGGSNLSGTNTGDQSWGGITGTLSSQTDLQTALNAKANINSISFSARNSAIINRVEGDNNNLIIFDEVSFNVGNGYNPTTGIFTAPEDGTYFIGGICYAVNIVGNSRRITFGADISGGNPAGGVFFSDVSGNVADADRHAASGGVLLELDQNDTVSIFLGVADEGGGVPGQPYQLRSQKNYFFGYKLP